MMGASHHPISVAAAIAHQLHVTALQADVVAHLLEGPGVHEGGDAVGPGLQAARSQAGGHTHHALLGHAGIDESGAQRRLQGFQGPEAQVTGQEHVGALSAQGHHGLAKGIPHAPTSAKARWYWASSMLL